jgi:hypothetical protein
MDACYRLRFMPVNQYRNVAGKKVILSNGILGFIGNKSPDEIERAIVKALTDAGRTTHGREWYTPTAIGVHSLAWAARTANGLGQAQIAGICALLYGMLDIFGFSGSVRLAINARNQMQQKMKSSPATQQTEATKGVPNGNGKKDPANSGLPKSEV